jgi:hypothetical protein
VAEPSVVAKFTVTGRRLDGESVIVKVALALPPLPSVTVTSSIERVGNASGPLERFGVAEAPATTRAADSRTNAWLSPCRSKTPPPASCHPLSIIRSAF